MIKFHLKLFPINKHVKPYEIPFGHIFQGVIFGWLHKNSPRLAHELHAYQTVRPYAINCHIHKEEPLVEFTIVSFETLLSSSLIDICQSIEGKNLEIAGKKYCIVRTKIEKIYLDKLFKTSVPVRRFHIHFVTPVHFQTTKGNYPVRFPLPSMLFGNLSALWNAILKETSLIARGHFLRWIDSHCYTSGYKMRSCRYFITTAQKVAGGQGSASYNIKKPNERFYDHFYETQHNPSPPVEELGESKQEFIEKYHSNNCRWIDLLCRLGEYTNVGGNRTAGMGVMRYFPKKYLEKGSPQKAITSIP